MKNKPLYITCGDVRLDMNKKTWIMGILNVTPDSFSDGGRYNNEEAAIMQAERMVSEGVDIIDIGGESTRPGHERISDEDEISRVVPIIKELKKRFDIPLSIDTYKSEVARLALEAGADIINDIWGAKADPKMAEVAARYQVPIILMHNRDNMDYQNLMEDMISDLRESIAIVKDAGVPDEKIILDPGIGFAKNYEHNLEVMRNLDKIVDIGYPILLATSRKRFIGTALNLPVDERVEGTGASVCLGIERGCHMVRVHDVKEMTRMARMMDAMLGKPAAWVVSNG
ncbi:dihydropteroate synthase [Schinkia azotoformans]|nr:dihydropteroate synthase [Schinkia azotoformans]MEC1697609.1 dihydropteroate synthase [Schinkia azotoformans]MEC1726732.1 dihydropteroate synthase [Schinkia azotoformans]MEC1778570.1 dihydropteroate synthase [Schinkia azotoformans]MED4331341.1 dihydropteroate synthase [Schinkia azotoformans]